MKVIERELGSKTGDPHTCEDGIAIDEHFAAVVDGATDKSGRRFEGMTGGRFLMLMVCDLIGTLPADIEGLEAVHAITGGIAARGAGQRPQASAVIYSRARRELWSIGDCGFWYAGLPPRPGQASTSTRWPRRCAPQSPPRTYCPGTPRMNWPRPTRGGRPSCRY